MTENLLIDDEIIFRTEDLKLKEIGIKFVETKKDRENIEYLKENTNNIIWKSWNRKDNVIENGRKGNGRFL